VRYKDWFGASIAESVDDLVWRIRSLEESKTRLKQRLADLGEVSFL
jgi:hypothetical protein